MTEQTAHVPSAERTEQVPPVEQTEHVPPVPQAEHVPPVPQAEPVPPAGQAEPEQHGGDTGPAQQPAPPEEADAAAAPPKDRRVLRAAVRWTTAVLVCGALGTGTVYGIASMERSDVPGLATESDGRWDYPRLSLPALPKGSPRPFTDGNRHEVHHADLRKLLLPAPAGATADKELAGGWVSEARFASEYVEENRPDILQGLSDSAVRHIAARGWTMPDGTQARVYLLRFNSADLAERFTNEYIGAGLSPDVMLRTAAEGVMIDEEWETETGADGKSAVSIYTEGRPYGPEHTRQAYLQAGDTVALIVHSRKGSAPDVPFHQTVVLQNQLLG